MEGRIGPDNDTLVGFLDLDGDPNEGHEDENVTPQFNTQAPQPPAAEGEGPETVVDMTDATKAPEGELPAEEVPQEAAPAEEEKAEEQEPEEEPQPEQQAAPTEKKKTPWQRTNELKRELAETRRIAEEAEQKRQAAEQLVQQQQQRLAAIEAHLQRQEAERQAAIKAAQPEEKQPEIPPYEENPLENLRGQLSVTQQIIKEANERQARLEQQSVVQQFEGRIANEEAMYAQKNPHYYEARDYLIDQAQKEFKAAGMTEQQIADTLQAYRVQFARTAWTSGKPIAEIVEEVARTRGYRPQQQEAEQVPTKPTAKEKVRDTIAREQQASASLARVSQTNGRPSVKITREDLLRMTDADMDRLDRENPGWMERYMQDQA